MSKVSEPCSIRQPLMSRKLPQLPVEKRQAEVVLRKESNNKLKDPKSLLKLAQSELKTGGTLDCCVQYLRQASSLQMEGGSQLPPLVLEKLLYQALVRCIEERDSRKGVEVAKLLCECLGEGDNSYPSLHFPPPFPEATMDASRLVIGAIINTARCCLELGETQYLQCIVQLCKNCDCWLGTIEVEVAAGYRERLFHIAWRVTTTSVSDLDLAATCWHEALRLLAHENTLSQIMILNVHRKGLSLEKKAGMDNKRERLLYVNTALEMYHLCYKHVTRQYDAHELPSSRLSIFSSAYVDWLQHFACLSEYVGNLKEAKAFLKTAHIYVAGFASANSRRSNPDKSEKFVLHAYVSILKLQMASMTTSQYSNHIIESSTSEMDVLEQERRYEHSSVLHTPAGPKVSGDNPSNFCSPTLQRRRRAGGKEHNQKSSQMQGEYLKITTTPCRGRLLAPSTPFTAMKYLKKGLDLSDAQQIEEKIFNMVSRAWDYVERCAEMLQEIVIVSYEGRQSEHQTCDEQTAASISAVLKAWRWVQKGCSTVLFWTDAGKNTPLWQNLQQRAFSVLGSLSRTLYNLPPSYCSPALGALSSGNMLSMAIDSYIRSAAAVSLSLDDGEVAVSTKLKLFLSAEHWLRDAENLFWQGTNSNSFTTCKEDLLALIRRIGAGWFGLGRSLLACSKSNIDEIVRNLWQGCELLEYWAFSEGNGSDDPFSALKSVQIDVRLLLLSKSLVSKGDMVGASLAAVRAFILCLDMNNDTEDSVLDPSWVRGGVLEGAMALAVEYLTMSTNEDMEECINSRPHSDGSCADLMDYLLDYEFECQSTLLKRTVEQEQRSNSVGGVCLYRILIEGLEKRCSYSRKGEENLPALLLRVCRACSTMLARAKSASSVAASAVIHRGCETKLIECIDCSECPTELHIVALLHSAGFERQLHSVVNFLAIDDNNSYALPDLEKASACVKRALSLSLSMNDAFLIGTCEMLSGLLLQGGTGDNAKQTHMVFCAALDTLMTSSLIENCKSGVIVKQLYDYYRGIIEDYFLVECDLARRAKAACLRGGAAAIAQVVEGLSGAGISYYRAGLPGMAELYLKKASCLLEGLLLPLRVMPDTAHIKSDVINDAQGVGLGKQPESSRTTVDLPSIGKRSKCEDDGITSAEPELSNDTPDPPVSDAYSGDSVQIASARIMFRALEALLLAEQSSREGSSPSCFSVGDTLAVIVAEAEKLYDSNPASESAAYVHGVCLMALASILESQGHLMATTTMLRDLLQICIRQAARDGFKNCDYYAIRMLSSGSSADHHGDNGEEKMVARQNEVLVLQPRWLSMYLEGTSWLGRIWKNQSFSRKAGRYVHMSSAAAKQLKGGGGLVRQCLLEEAALMISKRSLDPAEGLLSDCDRFVDEQYILQHDAGCLSLRHWKKEEMRLPAYSHTCCGCLWMCAVQSAEVLLLRGDINRHRGQFKNAEKCYADGNTLLEGLCGVARNDPRTFSCSIEACACSTSMPSSSFSSSLYSETVSVKPAVQLPQLLSGLLWRQARVAELLGDWISAQPLYETVIQNAAAPLQDKAIVLYRLARHALDKCDDPLRSHELLKQAIAISRGCASPRILRKLRRTAVVAEIRASVVPQGPNKPRQSPSWDTAAGHLLSIGIAHCNHMLNNDKYRLPSSKAEGAASAASEFNLTSATEQLFSFASGKSAEMKGAEALKNAVQQFSLPKGCTDEWIVVGLSLVPTNHLLFTRLRLHSTKCHAPVTVAVPLSQEELSILLDWRSIMEDNTASLKNNAAVSGEVTDQRGVWWRQRDALNSSVEEIMTRIENEWFKKVGLDTFILCKDINEATPSAYPSDNDIGHDTSRPSPVVHHTFDRKVISRLTVAQLKEELATRGVNTAGCRRKADFIELMLATTTAATEEHPSKNETESREYTTTISRQKHPLLLVLDENLLGLSWEAMPCLRGHTISRVPALPFIFSLCARQLRPCWSSQNCKTTTTSPPLSSHLGTGLFVVDPEHNLPHTRETLGSALGSMTAKHSGWEGYVGEKPPPGKIIQSLQERDWFIYCGHGSGGLLVDRDEVASLSSCSAAILMGCSSGRLKGQGDFEPSGMVAGYLFGGCQAVVANLWDVTDRDIDRYSIALLNNIFNKGDHSNGLCKAVSVARAACKMRFIVGHAPVCYGLPI